MGGVCSSGPGECFGFLKSSSRSETVEAIRTSKEQCWRIGEHHRFVVGIGAKDFERAGKSLDFALGLANSQDEVCVLHVNTAKSQDISKELRELTKKHEKRSEKKGVQFETEVIEGNPRQELLKASLGADMLVVGAGHKGYGSVARFMCEHSRVNTTVVKKTIQETGDIHVGIGANDLYGSLSALKLAFDLANNNERVIAVYVPVTTDVNRGSWARKSTIEEMDEGKKANDVITSVRERAANLVETYKEKQKNIQFEFKMKEGHFDRMTVRQVLMEATKTSRIMVLGSGRKGFGSVSRYLVENSECCPIVLAKYVRAESLTRTDTDV